jgi:hypothetical protein
MEKKLIFVSCGQSTEAEKTLGVLVKAVIDGSPGFEAYFAETVQDLEALGQHVLDGLRRCAGAVVVLQDRGVVTHGDGKEWGHRSSVWVNQEVAILAYRQFFEVRKIPILAFVDSKVKLEGAMTSLILNPRPLAAAADVANSIKAWLAEGQFADVSDAAFAAKWNQLTDAGKRVVAGLFAEGGHDAKQSVVRQAVMRLFQMDIEAASKTLQESRLQFQNTDLVKLIKNIHSGDEMSVHPTWEFQLRKQCQQWLAEQGKG